MDAIDRALQSYYATHPFNANPTYQFSRSSGEDGSSHLQYTLDKGDNPSWTQVPDPEWAAPGTFQSLGPDFLKEYQQWNQPLQIAQQRQDPFNPFADQFSLAVMALSAAAGGAALSGLGTAGAAAEGAGEAGVAAGGAGAASEAGSSGILGTGITASDLNTARYALSQANTLRGLANSADDGGSGRYAGGPSMAESGTTPGTPSGTTPDSSNVDIGQLLSGLLGVAPGLVGSGLSLAAMPEILKRLETLYQQNQGNFQQQQQYAQMYQGLLQLYQQQQQQAYKEQTGERATDRGNLAQANVGRAGVAARLSDPAKVSAGADALYRPMSQGMTDNLLRGVQRDLAMRGQSDGGAASRATADAMAPYYNQLQQQAMREFLASQQEALGAYNPLTGPYTGDPPRPPSPAQLPTPPSYVPGTGQGPQANQADAYKGLSNSVAQLGKLLFGAQTGVGGAGLLSSLLKGGSGSTSSPQEAQAAVDALRQNYSQGIPDYASTAFDSSSQAGLSAADLSSFADQGYDPSLFAAGL